MEHGGTLGGVATQGSRIAVVDSHPMVLAGLTTVLLGDPSIASVDGYRSVEQLAGRTGTSPDVVLLDLGLSGVSGSVAIALEHGRCVVAMSGEFGDDAVRDAFRAGVCSFVPKTSPVDEVVRAVRHAAAGESWIPPTLGHDLVCRVLTAHPQRSALSVREREVLSLVATGLTDQEIARSLAISATTVRSHLERIRDKTGRRRRADLTRLALEQRNTFPAPRRRHPGS